MSIRAARAEDLWRRVFSRNYANRYEKLVYGNLFCLGSGDIKFSGGISVIVGGNGVGKSTLAAALGELLETELAERYVGERSRLSGSELKAVVREGDAEVTREVSGGIDGVRKGSGDVIATESWWLDPGYWAFHTRRQVSSDQNFADVIEPLTPIELSTEQLATLEYIAGKKYERCLVYEIAEYADFDRFPYFRVMANGVEYGSEGMGQGELALMLVFWVLQDLRTNSILILEEPESHVSPRSQAALMNVIAEVAATKGVWTIITTHSPTIAARVPVEHMRLLVREGAQTSVVHQVRRHHVASVLGGGQGFNGIALVEDEIAKEFTVAILDEMAPDLLRQLEVLPAGGESKISASLAAFPKASGWFRLMGVYDGDQRGRVETGALNWPCVWLPGDTDPATLLKGALGAAGAIELFVAELRRDRNSVVAILDALVGVEPRDWMIECVRALVITKAELVRALLRVWLHSAQARELSQGFVAEIAASYDHTA
jgi:predicted ATPase